MDLTEITTKIDALNEQAPAILAAVEAGEKTAAEGKALIEDLRSQVDVLNAERDERIKEEEFKALKGELTTLQGAIADLRKAPEGFFGEVDNGGSEEGKALDARYTEGEFGFFRDIRQSNKGDAEARKRILEGINAVGLDSEGKALTEGVDAQGGYFVRPVVERQIVQTRELDNVLRGLCSSVNVTTNAIQLDQLTISALAGWVAELAQKPEATGMALATVSASVFTAAGLVTISNQLLADANPSVDQLFTAELAKRLVALEEAAFLAGDGNGKPLGILNTPGIQSVAFNSTDPVDTRVLDMLDAILDAIADVETEHGAPNAILMHPRTWTNILKAKDAQGAYYIDPTGGPQDPRTLQRGPLRSLWGYPVVLSNRLPTNLGGGSNQSRIIVGDFKEALILDRQGITIDESRHVYFTTNQTVFRAEQRVGFTAARNPKAFSVVGGTGLANL